MCKVSINHIDGSKHYNTIEILSLKNVLLNFFILNTFMYNDMLLIVFKIKKYTFLGIAQNATSCIKIVKFLVNIGRHIL